MRDERRAKTIKMIILYLITLISIQLAGILYFLQEPSLHKGIFLMIFLGTVLPVFLALIFARFVKIR